MKKISIVLFLLLFYAFLISQDIKTKKINLHLISFAYSYQLPLGDLKNRFGANSAAGLGYAWKNKKNLYFGIQAYYLFGTNVKDDVLSNISTNSGHIINKYGKHTSYVLSERGYWIGGKVGKVFNLFGPNKNSGIITYLGAGFLQHKIRIDLENNDAFQIMGDYKKGYDRLSNGLGFNQFVGYMYLSNRNAVNFYTGIEFYQAFTESRRDYDFYSMQKDNQNRTDILMSFKFAWIFTAYKKMADDYFMY